MEYIYAYGSEGIAKYVKRVSSIQNTASFNNNFIICHNREFNINEETILVSIYNSNGQLISVTNNETRSLSTINLSSDVYPNGLYLIFVKLRDGSLLRELVMLL